MLLKSFFVDSLFVQMFAIDNFKQKPLKIYDDDNKIPGILAKLLIKINIFRGKSKYNHCSNIAKGLQNTTINHFQMQSQPISGVQYFINFFREQASTPPCS